MNRNAKFFFCLVCVSLGLTACSDDYYDQEAYENLLRQAFPVDNVSPTHSWATMGTATADITVNGDYEADYTVAVYLENPLYSTTLTELYSAQVKSGQTITPSFSYLLAQPTVYVAAYTAEGARVVKSATIDADKHLSASFFGNPAAAARTRASESASDYPDFVRTLDDYLNPTTDAWGNATNLRRISVAEMKQYTAITDAELAIHSTLSNGDNFPVGDFHHYRVAAGTEITKVFHFNATYGVVNDAVLYIEGKVHLNGNTFNGTTLVVAPGGELIIDGNTGMSNAGRFIIMEGGTLSGADDAVFNVNNGGFCYNAGTIDYDGELNVNGSFFYNKGTIELDLLRNTSGGRFTNFGHVTARTNMDAADAYNSTVINGCYLHYTGDAGIGTLYNLDNSRLEVGGRAQFNQATQTLYDHSIIDAGEVYVNGTTFMGIDNTSAFAIIKTGKISFAGNIYVNQDKNNQYQNERWTWIARKVEGKSTIYLDWDNSETYEKDGTTKITLDNGYTMLSVVRGSNYDYICEDNAAVSIAASECTGTGYSGGSGEIPVADPLKLRFCFEDNYPSPGDYDFNDCVVSITPRTNVDGDPKKVTVTVSLEAVGALKKIAGVLHIQDLPRNAYSSLTASTDLDDGNPVAGYIQVYANDMGNGVHMVSAYDMIAYKRINNADVVLRVFDDAHWALSGLTNSYGDVQRYFYNTVAPDDDYAERAEGIGPAEVTYTFMLNDAATADLFTEANIDFFIVEEHNSIKQEVHTKPFKDDNVLNFTQTAMSTGNYVWAICVPGSFRYPIEWHSISGEDEYGYTEAAYPRFAGWVQGDASCDDWYNYPAEGLVF